MQESSKKKTAKSKAKKKKADLDADAELAAKLMGTRESTRNRDALGTKAKKDAARAQMREVRMRFLVVYILLLGYIFCL